MDICSTLTDGLDGYPLKIKKRLEFKSIFVGDGENRIGVLPTIPLSNGLHALSLIQSLSVLLYDAPTYVGLPILPKGIVRQ